ncbi:hypothetical protein SEA_HONK_62 [Microbacterium phage Honk]|uniref:Uncharacterized protein n=1 Tax=Microbacterium phage Honk TaxID=2836095 RepID=A0A8F3E8C4_9CAUD|nr:hypothetical protein SEA_HONK_62 [Microbacterium phage Honk]
MPNTVVERTARHYIAELRAPAPLPELDDSFLVAPKWAAFKDAMADLLEYLVDADGGIDGIAEMRALLHVCDATLPYSVVDEPCICPAHGNRPSRVGATIPAFLSRLYAPPPPVAV